MRRINNGIIRHNWKEIIETQGLTFWETELPDGSKTSYWREGSYYEFTSQEQSQLEADTAKLFGMCVEAGDYMVRDRELLRKIGIPDFAIDQVVSTWNNEPSCQSVFGRFDLRYAGISHQSDIDPTLRRPVLYEFNADTPTSLPESAFLQWEWLQQTRQGKDQWNQIFERLTRAWERNLELIERRLGIQPMVHFAFDTYDRSGEDLFNLLFMQDAGLDVRDNGLSRYETKTILMHDIWRDEATGGLFDGDPNQGGRHIDVLFKLYPWEWLVHEEFGRAAFQDMSRSGGTVWLEAPYKMPWSNKGLLPVLWKLFGTDPELSQLILPAYFEDEDLPGELNFTHVRKPLLSREGANVTIMEGGTEIERIGGPYGEEGYVIQAYAPLPEFPDTNGTPMHPVLGAWVVDGEPAGLGIRESPNRVTNNQSYFVPHVIGY